MRVDYGNHIPWKFPKVTRSTQFTQERPENEVVIAVLITSHKRRPLLLRFAESRLRE